MNNWMTYIAFLLYFLLLILIGIRFYFKSRNIEDYLLGGRGMGSWVTALSAQASDMSGWLLMGLPGAIYLAGMNQIWIAVGLVIGTFLNWIFVSARLRLYTGETGSMTLSSFIGRRFKDPTNSLRLISSVITLLFFTVYAASGIVGAGKLFESMFNIDYTTAVIIGMAVMIFYTLLGGFLAVCWTDLFQALLMVFAIVVLPFIAYHNIEPDIMSKAFATKDGTFNPIPQGAFMVAILSILSSAAWGLGYFGQPHILVRFMSVKSIKLLPRSITIAMVWVIISLTGAVVIGLLGIPLYEKLPSGDEEKVLIYMIRDFVSPYFIGVLLAAILAAIMSTISSQLLVCSSTLTEDIYANVIKPKATSKELLFVSRIFVLIISVVALILSFDKSSNIFSLVTFAWGGFGAAFGPVILMALYSRKATWQSALAGMVTGTIVMLTWYFAGFSQYMYEIVPGFLANLIVMLIINTIKPNTDKSIDAEYDRVQQYLKDGYTPENKDGKNYQ